MVTLWSKLREAVQDALEVFGRQEHYSGIGLFVALGRKGIRGRVWLLLVLGSIVGGFVLLVAVERATLVTAVHTSIGSGFLAVWLSLIWTLAIATAAGLPPVARLVIAVFSLYYLGLPIVMTVGSGFLLLAIGAIHVFELLHPASFLRRWTGRLLWPLAIAQFPPHVPGSLALSIGLKSIIGTAIAAFPIWRQQSVPQWIRIGLLWAGLTVPYVLAWTHSHADLLRAIEQMLPALWGLSVPLWLWIGADVIQESGNFGRFLSRRLSIIREHPYVLHGMPLVLTFLGLAALPLVVYDVMPETVTRAYAPLQDAFRDWLPDAYIAVQSAVVVVILMGVLGLLMRRRMEPSAFGMRYAELAIGALAFVLMFWQNIVDALDLDFPTQWWPLVLIGVGVFWEPLKGLRELTGESEDVLEWVCVLAVLLTTLVIFQYGSDPRTLIRDTTIWSILGAAIWGLPALFFTTFGTVYGFADAAFLVRPFLVGYGVMLPLMSFVPLETRWLTPIAFGIASVIQRHTAEGVRWLRWAHMAWIGIGIVAFLAAPWIIPVPILSLMGLGLERLFSRGAIDLFSVQFFFLAVTALIGAIPVAWSTHPRYRWIGWGIGMALWTAAAALLPLLP
jgi:hypothetical protein